MKQPNNTIVIELPFLPISVNAAYAGIWRLRHKSSLYKAFEKRMQFFFDKQDEVYLVDQSKFLMMRYVLYMPLYYKNWNVKKIDTANYEKVLSDTLKHYIIWFEDSKIKIMIWEKVHEPNADECKTMIYISEVPEIALSHLIDVNFLQSNDYLMYRDIFYNYKQLYTLEWNKLKPFNTIPKDNWYKNLFINQ